MITEKSLQHAKEAQKSVIRELEPLVRRSTWTHPWDIYAILARLNKVYNYLCMEETSRIIEEKRKRRSEIAKQTIQNKRSEQ